LDQLVQLDRLETLVLLVQLEQLVLQEWQDPWEVEVFQALPDNGVHRARLVMSDLEASQAILDHRVFQGSLAEQVPVVHQALVV